MTNDNEIPVVKKRGRPRKYFSKEEHLKALRDRRYERLGRGKIKPPGRKKDPNLTEEIKAERRKVYDREYYKNNKEKIKAKMLALYYKKKGITQKSE